MAEGFILVNVRPGSVGVVAEKMRKVAGVVAADTVLGLYDLVVRVSVRHHENITSVVLPALQEIPEVEKTVTCLVEADAGR
jgi:DNA-binding Lrp family transcriptional regulator